MMSLRSNHVKSARGDQMWCLGIISKVVPALPVEIRDPNCLEQARLALVSMWAVLGMASGVAEKFIDSFCDVR